jgi:hypothetical protein
MISNYLPYVFTSILGGIFFYIQTVNVRKFNELDITILNLNKKIDKQK